MHVHPLRFVLAVCIFLPCAASAQTSSQATQDGSSHWSFSTAPRTDPAGAAVCAMTAEPDTSTTVAFMGLPGKGMLLVLNRKDKPVEPGQYILRWKGAAATFEIGGQSDGQALMAPLNGATDSQGMTQRLLLATGGSDIAVLGADNSAAWSIHLVSVDRPVVQAFLYCLTGDLVLKPGRAINGR